MTIFIISLCASCTRKIPPKTESVQLNNSSVPDSESNVAYRPGLGEIMSRIQMHHAKLWFAGIKQNWKLAAYEIGEIKESLDAAARLETDRPEIKSIPMISPPIDSLSHAIERGDAKAFKGDFQLLTNTCNACHIANHFEFNVIIIPTAPPVTNQQFGVRHAQ